MRGDRGGGRPSCSWLSGCCSSGCRSMVLPAAAVAIAARPDLARAATPEALDRSGLRADGRPARESGTSGAAVTSEPTAAPASVTWARMYRVVHGWPMLAGLPVPLFLLVMLAGIVGVFGASMFGGLTAVALVVAGSGPVVGRARPGCSARTRWRRRSSACEGVRGSARSSPASARAGSRWSSRRRSRPWLTACPPASRTSSGSGMPRAPTWRMSCCRTTSSAGTPSTTAQRPLVLTKDGGLLAVFGMDGVDPEPLGEERLAAVSAGMRRALEVFNGGEPRGALVRRCVGDPEHLHPRRGQGAADSLRQRATRPPCACSTDGLQRPLAGTASSSSTRCSGRSSSSRGTATAGRFFRLLASEIWDAAQGDDEPRDAGCRSCARRRGSSGGSSSVFQDNVRSVMTRRPRMDLGLRWLSEEETYRALWRQVNRRRDEPPRSATDLSAAHPGGGVLPGQLRARTTRSTVGRRGS